MNIRFDASILIDALPALEHGLGVTLGAWLGGVALGGAIGMLTALLRRFGGHWMRTVILVYVEVGRGTPFLVQLFILYYGGPSCGLSLPPLTAGVIALALYGGAYFSEAFRAGFAAVPPGHLEAARCLGLSRLQIVVRIEVPQMLVIILPALTNLSVVLCKETAVLSVVTVPELTFVLTGIGSEKFAFVETLLALSGCYWILVEAASRSGLWLEGRLQRLLENPR